MRRIMEKVFKFINISITFSVISSSSILLALFTDNNLFLSIAIPIVFWGGLLCEQFFFWNAVRLIKIICQNSNLQFRRISSRIGVLEFSKTTEGFIADLLLATSFIVTVLCIIFPTIIEALQYITFFLFVLSFRLHCIFNGKNYRYKKLLIRRMVRNNES